MIDHRIAMGYQHNNLGSELADAFHARRKEQAQEAQQSRLAQLLPQAVRGDRNATDQIAGIDPNMFLKLSAEQKAAAKERTNDLVSAVRWADTPEKWEQVIDHYGKEGVDLTKYRGQFGMRDRAMLELGKIGEYLSGQPKPEYRTIEAGGSLIDVSNGNPRVVIAPNDGSQQMGQPAQGGDIQEGATATNPQTGEKIQYRNGQWVPAGGQTASPSGPFPSGGY
jgi:hypothetical protein